MAQERGELMRGTNFTLPVNYKIDNRLDRLNVYFGQSRVVAKFEKDAGGGWYPIDMGKTKEKLIFNTPEEAIEWWLIEESYLEKQD
jgi:hypothetical protein